MITRRSQEQQTVNTNMFGHTDTIITKKRKRVSNEEVKIDKDKDMADVIAEFVE